MIIGLLFEVCIQIFFPSKICLLFIEFCFLHTQNLNLFSDIGIIIFPTEQQGFMFFIFIHSFFISLLHIWFFSIFKFISSVLVMSFLFLKPLDEFLFQIYLLFSCNFFRFSLSILKFLIISFITYSFIYHRVSFITSKKHTYNTHLRKNFQEIFRYHVRLISVFEIG
jgi:hypothetical protein